MSARNSRILARAVGEMLEPRRLLTAYALNAIANFDGINQNFVYSNLVMDAAGNLYGTSSAGGNHSDGTVFEVAKGTGTITTLASFTGPDGISPRVGLIIDSTGNLYGVTSIGGPPVNGTSLNDGTVFEIAQGTGTITTLATFDGSNGNDPAGDLIMDGLGNLYGTTAQGGGEDSGTVFEVASGTGTITTLAEFDGSNGSFPDAGVVMDATGDLFGTTSQGGSSSEGTVFEVMAGSGVASTIATFNAANGSDPQAALIMDSSGNLYGTTADGGKTGLDAGTVFEIPHGTSNLSTLASFAGTDGANPVDRLYVDAAGDLFGTANVGGPTYDGPGTGNGTVFEIASGTKTITDLASFNGTNGADPFSGLTPDSSGNFYGTTFLGGSTSALVGTVFELSPLPGPTTHLVFSTQPSDTALNATITPPLTVTLEDTNGQAVTTDQSMITMSIGSGPGATLGGTISEPAISGKATFPDLSLNVPGTYTLTATESLATAPLPITGTSNSFTIAPATPPPPVPAALLAFAAVPSTGVVGSVFTPNIAVDVEDAAGQIATTDGSTVTLTIASGTPGALIQGTATAPAINGVATFSGLSLSAAGTYTLTATDGLLLPSTSSSITVYAAPTVGGLDPSFGTGGVASHNVGLTSTAGIAVNAAGKSILVGTAGGDAFGVTQYNADGSLDNSFGTGGGVTVTTLPGIAQVSASAILSDGDILVAGTDSTVVSGQTTGSQFALAEYTPAGVLDTTFGNGQGYVLTRFSNTAGVLSNDVAGALTVGPDGTIYIGGSSDANGHGLDFAIAAYTPTGSPSPTFGANGRVLLDFLGGDDSIQAMALGANGELIATGSAVDPTTGVSSVALAEFLATGALDPKFGTKGKIVTSVGGVADAATALTIGAKGAIVVGGYSGIGSASAGTLSANFLLLRYTAAGKPDNSFGSRGIVTTSFNQPSAISSVLVESNGTIIATGKTVSSLAVITASNIEFAVAQYTTRGQLDPTFNGTGMSVFSLTGNASPQSLMSAGGGTAEQPALLRNASLMPLDASSELMMEFNQLTQADTGIVASTAGGQLLIAGNTDTSTVEAAIITMGLDLTATLNTTLPQSVVGGAKGTTAVVIGEAGTELASGTFTVQLFASSTPFLATGATPFQGFIEKLKLKQGISRSVHLKFVYPASLSKGDYYLIASVGTGTLQDLNPANNISASATAVLIAPPFVELDGSGLSTPIFNGVKPASVSFTLMNAGNVPASSESAVEFLASTSGTLSGAITLATAALHFSLKPNASHLYKVKLVTPPPSLPAGTYSLVALLDPSNIFNDPSAATNFIVSGGTFVVA